MPCALCQDGIVHTINSKGYERAYRCPCPLGKKHETPVYSSKDTEKKYGFVLSLYKKPEEKLPAVKPPPSGRELASGEKDD